jgi:hypothetical protein
MKLQKSRQIFHQTVTFKNTASAADLPAFYSSGFLQVLLKQPSKMSVSWAMPISAIISRLC